MAEAQELTEVTPPCARVVGELWESGPWPGPEADAERCPWIRFDGRTTYRVFHQLERAPLSMELFLSFEPDGASAAPSAGDMTRILEVTSESVQLRNATNEDFFLRVVLR